MAFSKRKKRVFFPAHSVIEKKDNSIASKDRFTFIKFFNYYNNHYELDN